MEGRKEQVNAALRPFMLEVTCVTQIIRDANRP